MSPQTVVHHTCGTCGRWMDFEPADRSGGKLYCGKCLTTVEVKFLPVSAGKTPEEEKLPNIAALEKKHDVRLTDVVDSVTFDAHRVGAPGSITRRRAEFVLDVIDLAVSASSELAREVRGHMLAIDDLNATRSRLDTETAARQEAESKARYAEHRASFLDDGKYEKLERENARYKEREEHFAKALRVSDGGQYRADWDGAIARVIHERNEAQRENARLREALTKQAVIRVSRAGGERQWCRVCDAYTEPYRPSHEEPLKVKHAPSCALATQEPADGEKGEKS